jgi:hypothetical protein
MQKWNKLFTAKILFKGKKYLACLWRTKFYYWKFTFKAHAAPVLHKDGEENKKFSVKLSEWFSQICEEMCLRNSEN